MLYLFSALVKTKGVQRKLPTRKSELLFLQEAMILPQLVRKRL